MADAELALDAGEPIDHLVRRSGDDELAVQQLLIAHARQRAGPRPQRELGAGPGAHSDRGHELRGRAQRRAHAPHEVPSGLEGLLLRVRRDGADEEAEVVRRHRAPDFGGALPVVVEQLARDLGRHQERNVGVAAPPGPDRRLGACSPRSPDRRVRLLEWEAPGIDVTEVVVLAFPAEWPRRRPALEDEIVALLEALTVVHGVRVGPPGFDADAAYEY